MPFGYWGRIIWINLSTGKIDAEEPPEETYRRYLGGYGLGVHFLYQRMQPGIEPLGKNNILGFLPGLLTGSGAEFSGRFMVVARSPLTGAWGEANCGGNFGAALHGTGLDGLFITGKSDLPVYIYIDIDNIEIRDASSIWGLDVHQVEHALHALTSLDARIACIGPAGEKLSLLAGIVNQDGRLAARCGLGAVMGSKNLKAVVARGKSRPPLADPKSFKSYTAQYLSIFRRKPSGISARVPALMTHILPFFRRFRTKLSSGPVEMVVDSYRRYGTSAGTAVSVELGDTPVHNWTGIGYRDFPLKLSEGLSDQAVVRPMVRPFACQSCPVACGGIVTLPSGDLGHKPEYETLASFGPMTMVSDLNAIMTCNSICNMEGLDSISTGSAVAFALECAEKGWLPAKFDQELPLKWGDGDVVQELTRRIANRTPGLGEWLADGVQKAAQLTPPEARSAAIHAGGQELAMHRGLYEPGVAAGYALDPAPGRHTSTNSGCASVAAFAPYFEMLGSHPAARYDYIGKGTTQAIAMPLYRAYDSLGLCQFALMMGQPPFLEWLNAATGWGVDKAEFFRIGKQIQVLRHAFNARNGLPSQFALPARERGDPPQSGGPVGNRTLEMEAMAKSYFEYLGIDPRTGFPLPETAQELGLDFPQ
ncbi:MAG: aldehyde ferredoxin oxidoreductase family protein [Anaerolineales bacterium]